MFWFSVVKGLMLHHRYLVAQFLTWAQQPGSNLWRIRIHDDLPINSVVQILRLKCKSGDAQMRAFPLDYNYSLWWRCREDGKSIACPRFSFSLMINASWARKIARANASYGPLWWCSLSRFLNLGFAKVQWFTRFVLTRFCRNLTRSKNCNKKINRVLLLAVQFRSCVQKRFLVTSCQSSPCATNTMLVLSIRIPLHCAILDGVGCGAMKSGKLRHSPTAVSPMMRWQTAISQGHQNG